MRCDGRLIKIEISGAYIRECGRLLGFSISIVHHPTQRPRQTFRRLCGLISSIYLRTLDAVADKNAIVKTDAEAFEVVKKIPFNWGPEKHFGWLHRCTDCWLCVQLERIITHNFLTLSVRTRPALTTTALMSVHQSDWRLRRTIFPPSYISASTKIKPEQ